MLTFSEFRNLRKEQVLETRDACRKIWNDYKKDQEVNCDHTHELSNYNIKDGCVHMDVPPPVTTSIDSFASLQKALCRPAPAKGCFPWGAKAAYKQEEGNSPMSYSANAAYASVTTAPTEIQDQRKYLTKRLDEVYAAKRDPLEATFGLTDDDAPTTPKEYAERIAAGKFIIRGTEEGSKDAHNYRYWGIGDLIRWRDPAKKADDAGFAAARIALKAARLAALDTIKIDEPKAGLDAIKALEAWTPTGAAN